MDPMVSVKSRELIDYLEATGFSLLRDGAHHAIYTDGRRTVPVKRQKLLDRRTANEICKQAGLGQRF